jgi:hypothetical protein
MFHFFDIFNATEYEVGLLVETLRRFSKNPYVGGRSSNGFGRIDVFYNLIRDDQKEDNAIVISGNEGFRINSDFLTDCSEKFTAWLKKLDRKTSSVFSTEAA